MVASPAVGIFFETVTGTTPEPRFETRFQLTFAPLLFQALAAAATSFLYFPPVASTYLIVRVGQW